MRCSAAAAVSTARHYWGVTPIDAEGHDGTPSQVFQFIYSWPTDTTLTLTNLSGDPGVFDPQFLVDPVPGAAYYKVDVSSTRLPQRLDRLLHR